MASFLRLLREPSRRQFSGMIFKILALEWNCAICGEYTQNTQVIYYLSS